MLCWQLFSKIPHTEKLKIWNLEKKNSFCLSKLKRDQELKIQYTTFPKGSREAEVWEPDETFYAWVLDPGEKIDGADHVPLAVLLA